MNALSIDFASPFRSKSNREQFTVWEMKNALLGPFTRGPMQISRLHLLVPSPHLIRRVINCICQNHRRLSIPDMYFIDLHVSFFFTCNPVCGGKYWCRQIQDTVVRLCGERIQGAISKGGKNGAGDGCKGDVGDRWILGSSIKIYRWWDLAGPGHYSW